MAQKNEVHINATYHLRAGDDQRHDNKFEEYRRQWNENPKDDVVNAFPIHVDLEATSACNLQCPQCYQAYDETRPKRAFMDMELFKRIIDEGEKKGLMSIKLQYRGESLLHKELPQMVKYAKDHGVIEVSFNTNATLLTKEKSKQLIEAGLDKIICSIDSHIPEIYNKIRRYNAKVEGNFNNTLANVRALIQLKKEMKVSHPIVRITTIDMPETHEIIQDYIKFWMNEGADAVTTVDLNDYSIYKDERVLVSEGFTCEQPWQRLFVLADGLVTLCCGDLYQKLPLGKFLTKAEEEHYKKHLKETGKVVAGEGLISENGTIKGIKKGDSVEITHLRITETSANLNARTNPEKEYVKVVHSLEEVWRGAIVESVRQANRDGTSHRIAICKDCGYRNTTIKNKGLKHSIQERSQKIDVSIGRIKYLDKGIEGYSS